jgi:hypothetical protein
MKFLAILNLQPKVSLEGQRGVTLLMTVMILSGITLISTTVGFFTIQEIRSSRAIILSEPAISAAESAGEKAVWALKRSGTIANCSSGVTSTSVGNAVVDYCKSYGAAVIDLEPGQNRTIFLYNPDDINGDVDLSEFPYQFIQVSHISGNFSVSVVVTRLDGSAVGSLNVAPGGVGTLNVPAVPSGNEARMRVVLSSSADTTVRINTNQGIPSVPTIDASGCSGTGTITGCDDVQEIFKRRINIVLPE